MMLNIGKEKMIACYKVISILILAYMMIQFFRVFKSDEIILSNLNQQDKLPAENFEKEISKTDFFEKMAICENQTSQKYSSQLQGNIYVYYAFAMILGAFINAKKVIKIGII